MRIQIPLLITLAPLIVTSAKHKRDERFQQEINKEKNLRSDHRHLQYFPYTYLKTADAEIPQQAAEIPEGSPSVVTIESTLATTTEEKGMSEEKGHDNREETSGGVSAEMKLESALVTTTEEEATSDEKGSDNSKETNGEVSALRFNKFEMYEDRKKPTLTAADYPLSEAMARTLSYWSNAYSVVTEADYGMKGHDIEHYIEAVGGYPARPSKNSSDPYWDDFKTVVRRVRDRQLGKLPPKSVFHPPRLWAKMNVTEVTAAVHDEYPGYHQSKMIKSFITSGEGINIDHDIMPFRCREDFIGTDVMLAALNTWSIATVAPINFAAKWHVGQMRPEEMAWKIVNGEIRPNCVPKYARKMLRKMNLTKATDFTAFPEGSPLHCSWPAMHSAASSSSLWLAVVANLTEDQYRQVLRTDHSVAYARTIAGVHYPVDNIAGLNMGQTVIAEELPKHLAETYGADEEAVKAKIAKLRFDWNTYSPKRTTVKYSNPEPRSAIDMGYRFNKFKMYPEYEGPDIILKAPDYPLSEDVARTLRYESNSYSVVTGDDFEMRDHDVTHYIGLVGGLPPRPSPDPKAPYWQKFREVVQRQVDRRDEKLPPESIMKLPTLWEEYSAFQVAAAVHDEYPGYNQSKMIESFITSEDGIKLDYDVLPFRCRDDFIGTNVRLAGLNTWSITTVAPINFAAKWYAGQMRPEEMAWKIASGEIPKEDVPDDIYEMISDMQLQNGTSFTQYPEGSPLHPSWPAMHSAASSASLWLAVVADLTPEQYCQVLRTDFAVAYARTLAGVHYPNDNIAGLNMGQAVIAHELAGHLAKTYGADEAAANAKIVRFRFDWNTFKPGSLADDCEVVYGVEDKK